MTIAAHNLFNTSSEGSVRKPAEPLWHSTGVCVVSLHLPPHRRPHLFRAQWCPTGGATAKRNGSRGSRTPPVEPFRTGRQKTDDGGRI